MIATNQRPTTATTSSYLNHHATDRSMNSLRASNSTMNRSRSARNVVSRTLPILERGGSTRNFRELPPDRNLQGVRRRSNSTRRFFVADQNARGSANSGSSHAASSLTNQFRRVTLERTDSNSSMGSVQSWSSHASTLASSSNHYSSSNYNTSQSNNDSTLSILSMDSTLTMASRVQAPPSVSSADDSMMSLYSRDSVNVRHSQLQGNANNNNSLVLSYGQGSSRNGMVLNEEDDGFSLASSECTIYSFDRTEASAGLMNVNNV